MDFVLGAATFFVGVITGSIIVLAARHKERDTNGR